MLPMQEAGLFRKPLKSALRLVVHAPGTGEVASICCRQPVDLHVFRNFLSDRHRQRAEVGNVRQALVLQLLQI
jgi:hypothetical protein